MGAKEIQPSKEMSELQGLQQIDIKPIQKDQVDVVRFPNNPIITNWERLEKERLKSLNLGFNRLQGSTYQLELVNTRKDKNVSEASTSVKEPPSTEEEYVSSKRRTSFNRIAPFKTYKSKNTCGYFFDYNTHHKRIRMGIPPCNLPYWQSKLKYV